jgi:putative ABC transport system ATP-binding protein
VSPLLELDHVGLRYPGGVHAVRDVSLRLDEGELAAITGPSGSGKSTLLHLAGMLDRATTGHVRIAGTDVGALGDRRSSALRAQLVGFVFQRFHLADGVSALDNVADGLLYTGTPRAARRERARAALERVGLGDRLGHRPHQLSGGEQQRVAIARAVVKSPRLVLADEPTGNLDTASGAAIMRLLTGLHAAGTTIAIITHDADIAAAAPRRIRLRDGRIATDERTDTVPGGHR